MRFCIAFLIGILAGPSTWLLIGTSIWVSKVSPQDAREMQVGIAVLLMLIVTFHSIRELRMDLPWLGRSSPPPGLHCTQREWNEEFYGKPHFAIHLVVSTAIRATTIGLLLWHVAFR